MLLICSDFVIDHILPWKPQTLHPGPTEFNKISAADPDCDS